MHVVDKMTSAYVISQLLYRQKLTLTSETYYYKSALILYKLTVHCIKLDDNWGSEERVCELEKKCLMHQQTIQEMEASLNFENNAKQHLTLVV